ncbi:hypothetical protein [Nocardia asteroides]|uniref:hypothetical protein n=1 Tax=Nocardia asteroides TaxID=1824 RepID=UPI001E35E639|nr:hypothetical protein [Nocardia asteroides]UGT63136.1 hypothetical protein LTT61_07380 [Nocardia asteroides]
MQANVAEPPPLGRHNHSEAQRQDTERAAEGLLEARQLFLAFAGHLDGGSPLIEWSRELSDLHATLLTASVSETRRPQDFDNAVTRRHIQGLIGRIDEWSILHLPRPVAARRHTHSLGEVISHLARTYAHAHATLRRGGSAEHLHDAALHLARIQEGYADLLAEIRALRIELPAAFRGPESWW